MANAKNTIPLIRSAIKAAGFKARVRQSPGNACDFQVIVPEFDARFTADQIAVFCTIAKDAGFTFVMRTSIYVAHECELTGKQQWEFCA